ncbi:MAG: hypothetical protein QOH12_998 [Solirubrobacteraceae bacterium]|jgi:hypothetical protein|nr:hypothetical protein [Solirubrobacteraceae bacterium]
MPDNASVGATTARETGSAKRKYGRPELRELGSLQELTQANVGGPNNFDGSGYTS